MMQPAKIRRDARKSAFAGASADDEQRLNPWKNSRAQSWGAADIFGPQWTEEFMRESAELTRAAERTPYEDVTDWCEAGLT